MFLALVDLIIKQADLNEYVAYRQRHINPDMHATGAFLGTHLLRPAEPDDADGSLRCVMINRWRDLEVPRRFAKSASHIAQTEAMKALARITSVRYLERLDGLSYESANYEAAPAFVIARHRCHPGRGAAYVAAWTDVRKSIEESPGCAGVTLCAEVDDRDSFVAVYRWDSDNHADAHATQAGPEEILLSHVEDIVTDGLGSAARYSEVSQDRKSVV